MILIATGLAVLGGLVLAAGAVAACVLSSRITRDLEETADDHTLAAAGPHCVSAGPTPTAGSS